MKNIFIGHDLSFDSVKALAPEIEASAGKRVKLWIDSNGGNVDAAFMLTEIINDAKFDPASEIIITWQCSSSATEILFGTALSFRFMSGAFSVVHRYSREVETRRLAAPRSADYLLLANTEEDNKRLWTIFGPWFTEDEIPNWDYGDDIFLKGERMAKIVDAMRNKEPKTTGIRHLRRVEFKL